MRQKVSETSYSFDILSTEKNSYYLKSCLRELIVFHNGIQVDGKAYSTLVDDERLEYGPEELDFDEWIGCVAI